MGNTFGRIFRITTYGESHGKALGVTIDGCPAGKVEINEGFYRCRTRQEDALVNLKSPHSDKKLMPLRYSLVYLKVKVLVLPSTSIFPTKTKEAKTIATSLTSIVLLTLTIPTKRNTVYVITEVAVEAQLERL